MAEQKWFLITTLDDHSRRILYGDLWEKETSWAHIMALKSVVTQFGCPLKYYVDNHSIFRFIERRSTLFRTSHQTEAGAIVQWKEVLKDLHIETSYALSPQAKGKIERPYRWLQDHLVRTCAREQITTIEDARKVLFEELNQYNYQRIHSTTKEIPDVRYQRAVYEKQTLFKPFRIPAPYEKLEDIFCYRAKRVLNSHRRVSFHSLEFLITNVPWQQEVELRISFDLKSRLATIRFWYHNRLVEQKEVKMDDLKKFNF